MRNEPYRSRKPEEQIAWILDSEPVLAAGEGFRYGDINYLILGLILEKIDSRTLYQQIQEDLLDPLGLDGIVASNRPDLPNLAVGIAAEKDPLSFPRIMVEDGKLKINPDFEWAGGGFATRPKDLAEWMHLYAKGDGLSEAMKKAHKETVAASGVGGEYGLGIQKKRLAEMEAWGHDGFFPGYYSQNAYFPSIDATIVLQFPTSDFSLLGQTPRALMLGIANILKEELQ